MFIFFFLLDWFFAAIGLINRTTRDLSTRDEDLPPNASRGAAWAGLGIGLALLAGVCGMGVAAMFEESKPDGRYGSINGINISRADNEACGGDIFNCPGLILKYRKR